MPGGEASSSKERTAGGKRWFQSTHRLFSHSENCKPDEEQTWPLSFRETEMGISVSGKKRQNERPCV